MNWGLTQLCPIEQFESWHWFLLWEGKGKSICTVRKVLIEEKKLLSVSNSVYLNLYTTGEDYSETVLSSDHTRNKTIATRFWHWEITLILIVKYIYNISRMSFKKEAYSEPTSKFSSGRIFFNVRNFYWFSSRTFESKQGFWVLNIRLSSLVEEKMTDFCFHKDN